MGSKPSATVIVVLLVVLPLKAQVPAEFTNLYSELQSNLSNFEATVDTNWNGVQPSCLMAATLMPATSEGRGWESSAGNASTDTNFLNDTVVPYLDGLQAIGIKSIKFAIQFPVLYQPYYDATNGANNPARYTNAFNFYMNLVSLLRQRGIKIIIPTQNIVKPDATDSKYEANLTFAQYVAGRSAINQTIARYLKPDYLILQSEPDTEVANLPPSLANPLSNAAEDISMISTFLTDLQSAGLRSSNTIVGAGCGTWQGHFTNYLAGFTNLAGLDLLDIHVYPITVQSNGQDGLVNNLQRIIQMADAAHATNSIHPNGMRVGIGECWLDLKQAS